MFKKLVVFALILLLIVGIFAGCGVKVAITKGEIAEAKITGNTIEFDDILQNGDLYLQKAEGSSFSWDANNARANIAQGYYLQGIYIELERIADALEKISEK